MTYVEDIEYSARKREGSKVGERVGQPNPWKILDVAEGSIELWLDIRNVAYIEPLDNGGQFVMSVQSRTVTGDGPLMMQVVYIVRIVPFHFQLSRILWLLGSCSTDERGGLDVWLDILSCLRSVIALSDLFRAILILR